LSNHCDILDNDNRQCYYQGEWTHCPTKTLSPKKAQRAYLDKDHMCPALSLFEISSINLVTLANRWLYDLKNITPRLMWLNLILMMKF